jgi:hypothetical protein
MLTRLSERTASKRSSSFSGDREALDISDSSF